MGMYDKVWAQCPQCNLYSVEFQSKAGKCHLIDYVADTAPRHILEDIHGDVEMCDECGCLIQANTAVEFILHKDFDS